MNSHISEEALEQYLALVEEKFGTNFSEEEAYDFTRCVRPDGSSYGTRGKCRKGSETGPAEKGKADARGAKTKTPSAQEIGKMREQARFEEYLKVHKQMLGKSPEEQRRIEAEANARADKRVKKELGTLTGSTKKSPKGSKTERIQSLVGKAQKTIDKLEASIAKAKDGPYKQKVQAKIAKLKATQKKLQAEKQRLNKANPPQGEGFGNVSESMRSARD
jgi:hypothetical protein